MGRKKRQKQDGKKEARAHLPYSIVGKQTAKMADLAEQLATLRSKIARIDGKYARKHASPLAAPPPKLPEHAETIDTVMNGDVVETEYGKHFETEKTVRAAPALRQRRYLGFDGASRGFAGRAVGRCDPQVPTGPVGVSRYGDDGVDGRKRDVCVPDWGRKH